nr:MAG TPA: hypothetical protein [Caudoviricetes sp.]
MLIQNKKQVVTFQATALLTRATYNCYYTVNLCNCQLK